ncbi:MAG TPA: DinB family protein, partial [Thermoanaerobaculia bacterium]|nr:DinB family protein [Thermoanaerobaculia bacterium]
MTTALDIILAALDEAYERKSWHGTNLRGSLRGMTPQEAVWRPAPGRHNAWELAVHAAYWKYAVRRRLRGDKRGTFPLKG